MSKPTAVIDKSLLQAICEQTQDTLDSCFNTLLSRYVLVVPEILVEEIWVNLANPGAKSPRVVEKMVECLLHLQCAWIAAPLEIAFTELVKRESIEILPQPPPNVMNSFFRLSHDNTALLNWVKERRELRKKMIRQRVHEQTKTIKTQEFALVNDEREFFEKFIRPKFLDMLADPDRRRKLLENVLGVTFRKRHPDFAPDIDRAFQTYSVESFDKYPASFNCLITAMVYFYAPLCKIKSPDNATPRKILGRGFGDQSNNIDDEQYVQTGLLCARLVTRDAEMRNVIELFKACGLWNGQTVFINPNNSLLDQIAKSPV